MSTATEPVACVTAARSWSVWSTTVEVVVTAPETLDAATALVRDHLAEVDLAANRFREDSEIRRLPRNVSALFARHLDAALHAADVTDGLIDPTVGATLRGIGYDQDITLVLAGTNTRALVHPAPGWARVRLTGNSLEVPAGVELDLGATTKALAAADAAELAASRLPTGVLVNLGGDIATAGPVPDQGWRIRIDADGSAATAICVGAGTGVATSSTRRRRWTNAGVEVHHIIDPRTGSPAAQTWQAVTVAARSCLEANIASTAAIVLGDRAPVWLERQGLPARLVAADGSVRRTTTWPAEDR